MSRSIAASAFWSLASQWWMVLGPAAAAATGKVEWVGLSLACEGIAFIVLPRRTRVPPAVGALASALGLVLVGCSDALGVAALPVGFGLVGLGFELRRRATRQLPSVDLLDGIVGVLAPLVLVALWWRWPGLPRLALFGAAAYGLTALVDFARPSGAVDPGPDDAWARVWRSPVWRRLVVANTAMNGLFHLRLGVTAVVAVTGTPGFVGYALAMFGALVAVGVVSQFAPLVKGVAGFVLGPVVEGLATIALAVMVLGGTLSTLGLVAVEVARHLGMATYERAQRECRQRTGAPEGVAPPFLLGAWGASPVAALLGAGLAMAFGVGVPVLVSGLGFLMLAAALLAFAPVRAEPPGDVERREIAGLSR